MANILDWGAHQVGNIAGGIQHGAANIIRTDIVNPARQLAAQATHNPVAYRNAVQAQNKSVTGSQQFLQPILRTIPEALATVAHPTSQFTYHPGSSIEKALFGSTPIQNIQKNVANNYNTHANLNPIFRVGLAGADLLGHVAQDFPTGAAGLKTAKLGGQKALIADIRKPANLTPREVVHLQNYHSKITNSGLMDNATYQRGRAAARKAGVPHNDPAAISNLLGQFRHYNTRIQVRQQAAKAISDKLGVGKLGLSTERVGAPLSPAGKPLGKNLTPDSIPLKAGKGSAPPDFLATDKGYVPKTPGELANLSSKEQMAIHESKTPLRPPAVNTAKNPYKSMLTQVKPGNYKGAIQNSQLVSRPIETATSVWQNTMKGLSPQERTNFWRAVENPSSTHSPGLQNAIAQWRAIDNKVHGESQALGGNTNYLTNHNLHPWQLPEEYTTHIINGGNPSKFTGLNNISRKYMTIAEGEKAGLKLGTDPVSEGTRYLQANASILRKQALKKGLAEADSQAERQPHTLDLGAGHTVSLSTKGFNAAKSVQSFVPSANPIIKGVRTANQGVKSTLLSLGQFHTINIGALRAAPTLIAKGHPAAAAKGLYGMFRSAFGSQYADDVIGKALKDGTVDKAAQIGMPFGGSGYDTTGTFLKHGVGSRTVFGKQIPMMHNQVVRSIISDLEKKNVALDSPQAREAGLAGANMMGELNGELQNISPRLRKSMSDWLLAGQFTPSKFIQVGRAATKGGVAGSYARANVLANVAATTGIIAGLGYIGKQKSDNIKDLLLRALIDPAAPTSQKDSKGNTIKLRTPGTDTSDIAKLLGIKLVRNDNGHLGVNWNIHNAPSTVADFARARLSPFAASGVKIATNTTFANNPMHDPTASSGTQRIQDLTSLVTGNLPIGLQGLAYTNAVKSHLPGTAQAVLNASTPGTNPLIKSIGSSFGVTPSTDQTVGKGKQTADYFASKDAFTGSLNANEKALFNKLNPAKKDAFGNQTFASNVLTKPSDWADLQANNGFLNKYVVYQRSQHSHDPIWDLNAKQLNDYINLQKIKSALPGSTSQFANTDSSYIKTVEASKWYKGVQSARSGYFGSLQSQGVKLNSPSSLSRPSTAVQQVLNQIGSKGVNTSVLLGNNPDAEKYLTQHATELNQQRADQGLPPLPIFPTAPNSTIRQKDITYSQLPSGTGARSAFLKNNPDYMAFWQQKQNYYTALDGSGSSASSTKFGSSSGGGRPNTGAKARATFKTSKVKAYKPKGIKVKKVAAFKAPRTRKLSVTKLPSNYLSKKLA